MRYLKPSGRLFEGFRSTESNPENETSLIQEHSETRDKNTQPQDVVNSGCPLFNLGTNWLHAHEANVSAALARDGWSAVGPEFLLEGMSGDVAIALEEFLQSVRDLPNDPRSPSGNRRRRYQQFYYHPWSDYLESRPPVWDATQKQSVMPYMQSTALNPEDGGAPRPFASFTANQRTNGFLRWAVKKCYRSLPWRPNYAVIVGVHVIQLVARVDLDGASSPDCLHQDGEPWTWAFLLDRRDVIGGESVIGTAAAANKHPSEVSEDNILVRFTLEEPMAGFVVADKRVSHYVSPVSVASGKALGGRTILLIDLSPAVAGFEI